MRVVVQRVSRAAVKVEGRMIGRIGPGLVVLVGFAAEDGEDVMRWVSEKLRTLRVFPDDEGRMNRAVGDVGGEMLIVSQFTLYGDVSRGRRPSFVRAAPAEAAKQLYEEFVQICREGVVPVATGEFGARMELELVNDGPVTLMIER